MTDLIPHVRWSYSAVSSFDKCPLQYAETRVHKNYQVDSPQIREGNRVHKLFEDRVLKGDPLPPEWAHYEPMILRFLTLPGTSLPEYRMKINDQAKPIAEDNWEYWLLGIIDLLNIDDAAGIAYGTDWKTGKSAWADTQQLKLMALLVFAHFPNVHTVRGALIFVKEDKAVDEVYTRDKQLDYWEHFMPYYNRLRAARASGVYNAKPSGLCKVCPVKTCSHYRGA